MEQVGSHDTLIPFIPLACDNIRTDSMSLACWPVKTWLGGLPLAILETSFSEIPPQPITTGLGLPPPPPLLVGSTVMDWLVLAMKPVLSVTLSDIMKAPDAL